jgi:hypothetical protein
MSRVSYFQRFSQRENHATNNTLLVLRYLYQAAPYKLEQVLGSLLDSSPTIGLSFDQQVKGSHSVPDALIVQKPLRIYIETKLGDGLWHDQIKRHVASITSGSESIGGETYLIGLTRAPIGDTDRNALAAYAKERGVQFQAVTFSQIADALRAACADYEPGLIAIVEDYRSFLEGENLLDDRGRWMAIFPCGTSFPDNERLRLYYEGAERPSKDSCRFIGIYTRKTISLIGEPAAILVCAYDNGTIRVEEEERGKATPEMLGRIKEAFEKTDYYDLRPAKMRFYLVYRWSPTALRKRTPGGIMGLRYIDLPKYLPGRDVGRLPADEIAAALRDREFD